MSPLPLPDADASSAVTTLLHLAAASLRDGQQAFLGAAAPLPGRSPRSRRDRCMISPPASGGAANSSRNAPTSRVRSDPARRIDDPMPDGLPPQVSDRHLDGDVQPEPHVARIARDATRGVLGVGRGGRSPPRASRVEQGRERSRSSAERLHEVRARERAAGFTAAPLGPALQQVGRSWVLSARKKSRSIASSIATRAAPPAGSGASERFGGEGVPRGKSGRCLR
jgi:hypothetical protein